MTKSQRVSIGQPTYRSGAKKARINTVADFETTTDENDCRVWVWGIANVDNPETVETGLTITDFIDHVSGYNSTCYFHNLKFDGTFIIDWLLKHGFMHVSTNENTIAPGTFKTLISDMGKYFSITVRWENGHNTEFRDSWKKIPMSVRRMAKAFKLAEGKGDIDYEAYRPRGYRPTLHELDYLRRDVTIVAQAMKEILDTGMTKLTVASDSLAEYKRIIGATRFANLFPVFKEEMDAEIRRAYRGGWTYLNPKFGKQLTGSGLVLDVNSLYPYVMMDKILPYGEPEFVSGKVEPTKERPLTIFSVTFTAKLKPNHLPCIQIKNSGMFGSTEYLTEIKEPETLMVTNVDWALYNDHYDIDVQMWGGGWRFHAVRGMFDDYINKWSAIKVAAVGGKREIAKLHLNSLYGKFATNPNVTSKLPTLVNDAVKLVRGDDEVRPPVYTAVGVFITSFARDLTIRAAQANFDTFAYADTDSLHLMQDEVPEAIEVHPSKLGAWKLEYKFDAAFYIRPKAYLERTAQTHCEHDSGHKEHGKHCHYVTHIAGLPDAVTGTMTFADMVHGKVLTGKLHPKNVPGGVVLEPVPFELKI